MDDHIQRSRTIVLTALQTHPSFSQAPPAFDVEFSTYGVDSIGLVRIVLALETVLGMEIPESELVPSNFRCGDSVAILVAKLLSTITPDTSSISGAAS